MPTSTGKSENTKKAIGITVFGLVCTVVVLYVVKHKKPQTQKPSNVQEVKYVFFSTDGKPITLTEQDVFDIKQKYEDGVLPTSIADEYNMNAVIVCRIINTIKTLLVLTCERARLSSPKKQTKKNEKEKNKRTN